MILSLERTFLLWSNFKYFADDADDLCTAALLLVVKVDGANAVHSMDWEIVIVIPFHCVAKRSKISGGVITALIPISLFLDVLL